jgi:hypothetical protein
VKLRTTAIIIVSAILLLFIVIIAGIAFESSSPDQDLHLERQTFSYKDKQPGGCYVMFESLPSFYDGERPSVVSKPFAATAKKDINLRSGEGIIYFLVADVLYTTVEDVDSMIEFVNRGNQLFIAVNDVDSVFQSRLYTKVAKEYRNVRAEQHYVNPALAPDTMYVRDSIAEGRYFTLLDTPRTTILGTDNAHRPNFISINVGKGKVFFLLQPSTLTNYFLVYKNNIGSLEKQAAYTYGYSTVYWDEFYKYQKAPQRGDFSEWSVLMRYPALRWALWLLVLLVLVYAIFESKRRQRIIPDKVLLTNNSLEFVDALGQLYYQQHDNVNLARKIIMQWLEFIRARYYLNTNAINDDFIRRLAHKSGMPLEEVESIIDAIHFIQLADKITDTYLQDFYSKIQAFYLNTK